MRKTITAILLTTILIFLSSVNLFAQTRISFRRSASSATISTMIPPGTSRTFVVRANAGQFARVSVNQRVLRISTPEAPKGESGSASFEMAYGDNYIDIYNPSNHSVSYRMTITIR